MCVCVFVCVCEREREREERELSALALLITFLPVHICLFVYRSLPIPFCVIGFFYLNLYVPSTIFQLNRDGSSWVEPVLS